MARRALAIVCLAAATAMVAAVPVGAKDPSGDEVRVEGTCGAGAEVELRLKADDGGIELEYRLDKARAAVPWRIAIVHERRLVWKGTIRTAISSGSLRVRRVLPDLPGADMIAVRAWGPNGVTCRVTASLAGDV